MEHQPQPAPAPVRDLTRPAAILGISLVLGTAIAGLGFWLAFDRAMDRFEQAVTNHAAAVRDAGVTIAKPQIRVVDPLPIQEPVKIRGIKDDGTVPIEAKLAK